MNVSKKKERQCKLLEYLLYILVFLTPLFFCNTYKIFTFGAPKEILIIGFVLISLITYVLGVIFYKKFSFKFNLIHIILGFFLFLITLSSILGVDPLNSFFGKWTEGISLILIYSLAIFSLLIGYLIKKDRKILNNILLISFISSLIVAAISYFGRYFIPFLKDSTSSTLGNSSYTGAYLIFNICFGIYLFISSSKTWRSILIALGTLFMTFSPILFNKNILLGKIGLNHIINNPLLLLGTANAASLGLMISFITIFIFYLIFSQKKLNKIIGLFLLFTLILSIFYTSYQLVNPKSIIHQTYVEVKGNNRFIAWDIAKEAFYSHPFLGSGFNNFSYDYQKYFVPEILGERDPELYFNQPHSVILEYAASSGIIGLASYLTLLFTIFVYLSRLNKDEDKNIKIIIIAILFGYLIQNLFGFDTPVTYLMFFLIIGITIGLVEKNWIFNFQKTSLLNILCYTIIFLCIISLYIFLILPIKELREWGKITLANNITEKVESRNKAQSISFMGGVYDSSYLALKDYKFYKNNLDKINENNKKLFIKEINSIINQLERDINKQPNNDTRPYILISQFSNMIIEIEGRDKEDVLWNKSYENLQKALNINSKNTDIYLLLTQTYLLNQDFNNAYLSIHRALEINPKDKNIYDYAYKILRISPNYDFQKYLNGMEKKWITN